MLSPKTEIVLHKGQAKLSNKNGLECLQRTEREREIVLHKGQAKISNKNGLECLQQKSIEGSYKPTHKHKVFRPPPFLDILLPQPLYGTLCPCVQPLYPMFLPIQPLHVYPVFDFPPSPPSSNAFPTGKAGDHYISQAQCSPTILSPTTVSVYTPLPPTLVSNSPPSPPLLPTLPPWVRQVTITYHGLSIH